jgi:hypothetical protein
MRGQGKKVWVIPGGYIPLKSTGPEPDLLSQDRLAVLNLNRGKTSFRITVFYEKAEPVSFRELSVQGKRVKKIRINDLINPLPVPLETPYALLIEADKVVVVQFLRMFTGSAAAALTGTMAFSNGT